MSVELRFNRHVAETSRPLTASTASDPMRVAEILIDALEARMGREPAPAKRGPKLRPASDDMQDDLFHTVSP